MEKRPSTVGRRAVMFALVEAALCGAVMGKREWHIGHTSPSCPLVRLKELYAEIREGKYDSN